MKITPLTDEQIAYVTTIRKRADVRTDKRKARRKLARRNRVRNAR